MSLCVINKKGFTVEKIPQLKIFKNTLGDVEIVSMYITVLVYLTSPPEFKWIYPPGKIFLLQVEKDTLIIIFLCHFHWENVYQGKIERLYIRANWNAYIRASLLHKKLQKNGFYKSRLSYKGRKWWKIDPSGKPQFEFEGGGE